MAAHLGAGSAGHQARRGVASAIPRVTPGCPSALGARATGRQGRGLTPDHATAGGRLLVWYGPAADD